MFTDKELAALRIATSHALREGLATDFEGEYTNDSLKSAADKLGVNYEPDPPDYMMADEAYDVRGFADDPPDPDYD